MDYGEEYIRKNPSLHLEHSDEKTHQILSVLPPNMRFSTILDVACGAGKITTNLALALKPKKIVGIDISEVMIAKAKELDRQKIVNWQVADIYTYQSNQFDLIICADIIEHLDEDQAFLNKLRNMGKHLVLRVPLEASLLNNLLMKTGLFDPWKDTLERYGHVHHYADQDVRTMLQAAGFSVNRSQVFPLPKRTKPVWELVRILSLPLAWISRKLQVTTVGGFSIYFCQ